ncbi:hypothetical protein CLAIMM_01836 [Cladophialophora immunda]|nr:hypothetical protein CLAIMM_01836 [Cladophialophora immunda]
MNSTFKVTPAVTPFDIIQYRGPPCPKPRRTHTSRQQGTLPEKYSLPDLAPNSCFDEFDHPENQRATPELADATSLDSAGEVSLPSTPDNALADLDFTVERPDYEVIPDESALSEVEIEESQPSALGYTAHTDKMVLQQWIPSWSASSPMVKSDLGVDNTNPSNAGDIREENASTGSAQSDNDKRP